MAALRLPDGQPLPARTLRLAAADDDRAAVVADTVRRAAARHRVAVAVARAGPDRLDLNVPPPDLPPLQAAGLTFHLAVGEVEVAAERRLAVRPWSRRDRAADPLAVRLLLLSTPLAHDVDPTGLPAAAEELARWRRRIGEWARLPSAAPPAAPVAAVGAAVDDGIDTARALGLLRDLEADTSVPPGARMEAFLSLDRLLGLDLALGLVAR